tara:strand:- start:1073 stop:1561 length:489 start_codon:yes stop_codon:yes gene_type:complete
MSDADTIPGEATELEETKSCRYKHPESHELYMALPLGAFGKMRSAADGLNYWCKDCVRQVSRHQRVDAAKRRGGLSEAEKKEAAAVDGHKIAPAPPVDDDKALVPVEQPAAEFAGLTQYEADIAQAIVVVGDVRREAREAVDEDLAEVLGRAVEKLARELVR